MAEMAWMTNDPDTLPFLAVRNAAWPDQGGFKSGYYSNPQVDELLEQARVSTSQTVRAVLYKGCSVSCMRMPHGSSCRIGSKML